MHSAKSATEWLSYFEAAGTSLPNKRTQSPCLNKRTSKQRNKKQRQTTEISLKGARSSQFNCPHCQKSCRFVWREVRGILFLFGYQFLVRIFTHFVTLCGTRHHDRKGMCRETHQIWGLGKAQWWEHPPPTPTTWVRFLDLVPHVGWVIVSFRPCSEGLSPSPPVFLPPQKAKFQIPIQLGNSGQEELPRGVPTFKSHHYYYYYYYYHHYY